MRQRKLLEQQAFRIAPTQSTDKVEFGLVLGRWSYIRCKHQGLRSRLGGGNE